MKKLFFNLFLAVMACIFVTSCQQEELAPVVSEAEIIEQFNAIHGDEIPSVDVVKNLYKEKTSSLKSATLDPDATIGIIKPLTNVYVLPNGAVKQVLAWIIVDFGRSRDQGIIIGNYDNKFNLLNWELFIGWEENEFCNPVSINMNVKNIQTGFIFSVPVVGGGSLNYQTFSHGEQQTVVWLPMQNYNLNWEVYTNANFGGLISFNSAEKTDLNITVGDGINVNTFDYVIINLDQINVAYNSKMVIHVFDEENNCVDRTEFMFPVGKLIPNQIKIPLTFRPHAVEYQIVSYPNGMAKFSDWIYSICKLTKESEGIRFYRLE